MNRDQQLFQAWWALCGADRVVYHWKHDFTPAAGDLLLFDESDELLFDRTNDFADLVGDCSCICFTATPGGESESKILERHILKWLGLQVVGAREAGATALKPSLIITDLEQYVDARKGPVIVWCTPGR